MAPPAGEYSELRREILQWQQLRVVVLAAVMAAVTTTLAKIESLIRWEFVSSMLLFIVLVGLVFSVYAARGNAKLAAYIRVFHESDNPGWETYSHAFKKDFATGYFNTILTTVYLALGAISLAIPLYRCREECWTPNDWQHTTAWVVVAWLALSVLYLTVWEWSRGSSRLAFEAEWQRIKDKGDNPPNPSDDNPGQSFRDRPMVIIATIALVMTYLVIAMLVLQHAKHAPQAISSIDAV